jgi:hypothetical protein
MEAVKGGPKIERVQPPLDECGGKGAHSNTHYYK